MPTIRARDLLWTALAVLLAVATALMAPGVVFAQEGAHGVGHAQMHHAYKHWVQPDNGASCCDDRDCRPTRARGDMDGNWEAWNGSKWIPIPRNKILKLPSPDGRSHLCSSEDDTVYCFLPAGPKS